MKYRITKNEEKAKCVICKKNFVRKKKSKRQTCSTRCESKLRCKTKEKNRGIEG